MRRVAMLAIRFNLASKTRFILLTLIAAVSMTVFLVITEFSRLSSQDLKQSISEEAGQTGTYAIDFSTTLGLTPEELAIQAFQGLRGFAAQAPVFVELLPQVSLDCPPGTTLGSQPVLILKSPVISRRPHGSALPSGTEVCLSGQSIPDTAFKVPTRSEKFEWLGLGPGSPNSGVIISSAYERLAKLSSTQPATYRFVMVTNQEADQSTEIQQALRVTLEPFLSRYGISATEAPPFDVTRLDSAQEIRRAAAGVDLVYSLIAWGVLALAALGLLVAEMIVVRDRSWFFGLSRALGGRGSQIASLVLVDILLVLMAGTVLALGLALAVQPLAASFANSAFQVPDVTLVRLSTVPQLIIGEFLVLLLAGCYPALKAVRQDPLDVLEPRIS